MVPFYLRSAVYLPRAFPFYLNYFYSPQFPLLEIFFPPLLLSPHVPICLKAQLTCHLSRVPLHQLLPRAQAPSHQTKVCARRGRRAPDPPCPPIPCPAESSPCWAVPRAQPGAVGHLEPTLCFVASFWKEVGGARAWERMGFRVC